MFAPLSILRRRTRPPIPLPDELLLVVFESLSSLTTDTFHNYQTLIAAAQVCRQWRRTSNQVLLRNVEVVRQSDAEALRDVLRTGYKANLVESLAICSHVRNHAHWADVVSSDSLLEILTLTPRLRQLVLFYTDFYNTGVEHVISPLSDLSNLQDVTIGSAISTPQTETQVAIIESLPSHVQYLQLPGTWPAPPNLPQSSPSFELRGLTTQVYPDLWTGWVLGRSSSSLQTLTITTLTSVPHLMEHHPNITSLVVLGSLAPSPGGLGILECLQYLELGGDTGDLPGDVLQTLPKSTQCFRFRCSRLAGELCKCLDQLPSLKTVVWDHRWRATDTEISDDLQDLMTSLAQACLGRSIKLEFVYISETPRKRPRPKFPKPGFPDHDPTMKPLRTVFPTRIFAHLDWINMLLNPSLHHLTNFDGRAAEAQSALWERCFRGRTQYFFSILPRIRAMRNTEKDNNVTEQRFRSWWLYVAAGLWLADAIGFGVIVAGRSRQHALIVLGVVCITAVAIVRGLFALKRSRVMEQSVRVGAFGTM